MRFGLSDGSRSAALITLIGQRPLAGVTGRMEELVIISDPSTRKLENKAKLVNFCRNSYPVGQGALGGLKGSHAAIAPSFMYTNSFGGQPSAMTGV